MDLVEYETPPDSIYQIKGIDLVISFVKEQTRDYDTSHDYYHAERVATTSFSIMKEMHDHPFTSSETKVVIFSSFVHDVCDRKYIDPEEGKKKIERFLGENGLCSKDEVDDILLIIDNMSFSKEVKQGYPEHLREDLKLLRDIVSDSDKIDALGERGKDRCIEVSKKFHPNESHEVYLRMLKEHCKEKLLLLKDNYIRTFPGKRLSEEGHNYLLNFIKNIQD